jgi:hypothetical protein
MPVVPAGNGQAAGVTVGQAWLCGQGALAVAFAKMPVFRTQLADYEHQVGVGITEIRGQIKCSVAGTQTGMVSIFHAASPDA